MVALAGDFDLFSFFSLFSLFSRGSLCGFAEAAFDSRSSNEADGDTE